MRRVPGETLSGRRGQESSWGAGALGAIEPRKRVLGGRKSLRSSTAERLHFLVWGSQLIVANLFVWVQAQS